MTKQQIFEQIDQEVKERFGPDMFRERDFDDLMSDSLKMKLFKLYEDDMYAAFGFGYDTAFDSVIIPEIEKMYRNERLFEHLQDLIADSEDEHNRIKTQKRLMPGMI